MRAGILQRYEDAEQYLLKALALSYGFHAPSRLVQNLIRLAHVYQWKRDFDKSHLLFSQAKALIDQKPVSEILHAAYHQHLGKLYFQQQIYDKAEAEFSIALNIRERVAAPQDQIESSTMALHAARTRSHQ